MFDVEGFKNGRIFIYDKEDGKFKIALI